MKRLLNVFEWVLAALFFFAIFTPAKAQEQPKEVPVRVYRVKIYSEQQREELHAKAAVANLLKAILEDDEKQIIDLQKYKQLEAELKKLGYRRENTQLASK